MGRSKLTAEEKQYAILALAAGSTLKAVHYDLEQRGADITYSGVKAFRNRNTDKIAAATKDLSELLPSVDKNKRIAGRELDLQRIENRLATDGLNITEFNALMRTKNSIRDSIAREQEGFTSKTQVSQHTTIEQEKRPEDWWREYAQDRRRVLAVPKAPELESPGETGNRFSEIREPGKEDKPVVS